jgi:hypothetical protein
VGPRVGLDGGDKSALAVIRSPNGKARSKSLYRLRYSVSTFHSEAYCYVKFHPETQRHAKFTARPRSM